MVFGRYIIAGYLDLEGSIRFVGTDKEEGMGLRVQYTLDENSESCLTLHSNTLGIIYGSID